MSFSKFRIILALLLLAGLTFLFFESRFVDQFAHDRYVGVQRQLAAEDAALNQEILKISYSVSRSYDSIVEKFANIGALESELMVTPTFVSAESSLILERQLSDYMRLVEDKRVLFQRFRKANVRLRNSLSYLPLLSAELTGIDETRASLAVAPDFLKDLLRDVLLYVLSSRHELAARIEGRLEELENAVQHSEAMIGDYEIALVVAHVRTILRFKPELDQIAAEVLNVPTADQLESMRKSYSSLYDTALDLANQYRVVLSGIALLLLLWGGFTFFRLSQTSAELTLAKEGLEENVALRTQELAGSQARNRALLDAIPDLMVRISREGRLLDLKPSADFPLKVHPDELLGGEVSEHFPELVAAGKGFFEKAIETGEPQSFTFQAASSSTLESRHYESRIVVSGKQEAMAMLRDVTVQKRSADRVAKAQQRSEELLRNILPDEIAEELKEQGSVEPRYYGDVSILTTTFVGFSKATEDLAAEELVFLLDDYFAAFDEIVSRYRLEKLKTVADRYICAGGIPRRSPSHPVDTVLAGLELIRAVEERDQPGSLVNWKLRIGVHTGPVVAGVVGTDKFAFDLFGHSVRFCSQVERNGIPNRLNLSASTYRRVKDFLVCQVRPRQRFRFGSSRSQWAGNYRSGHVYRAGYSARAGR